MKDTNGQEMNDPKRNQAPQSEPAERPQETQFGQEFSEEVGVTDVNTEESGYPSEQKDARGGNHNPKGANQYTSGRVDDRGRKGKEGVSPQSLRCSTVAVRVKRCGKSAPVPQ